MNRKWKVPRRKRPTKGRRLRRNFRPLSMTKSTGSLTLCRKTNTCYIASSATQGTPLVVAGAGVSPAWLALGTPIPINGSNYDVPFAMEFAMSDIIAHADVVNIADQYKINGVQISINYNSNSADVNGPASMPGIYYIQDHDDAGVQPLASTRARMGLKYKSWGSNRTHVSFTVRPKPAPLIYNSGGVGGYSIPLTTTWLNTLNPDVPHYGIRGYFTNMYLPGAKDQASLFAFDITYSITAKDLE